MLTEFKLKYQTVDNSEKAIPVIIVAAGSSTRMKGENKQFLLIDDVPVIAKTLQKFEKSEVVSRIILVTKADDVVAMQNICEKYSIEKVSDIVEGGKNRNESVLKGFSRLLGSENKVLIHDGARPFVTEKIIKDTVLALNTSDAVLVAIKVNDTVKRTDGDGLVTDTVSRDNLYLAQTPQGVDTEKYIEICKRTDSSVFTDDASVMEYGGYKTTIVEGSRLNIKITTPEDIPIARAYNKILEESENI